MFLFFNYTSARLLEEMKTFREMLIKLCKSFPQLLFFYFSGLLFIHLTFLVL